MIITEIIQGTPSNYPNNFIVYFNWEEKDKKIPDYRKLFEQIVTAYSDNFISPSPLITLIQNEDAIKIDSKIITSKELDLESEQAIELIKDHVKIIIEFYNSQLKRI